MIENVKYDIVYSEIYEILNLLGDEYINKIPSKLYQEFKKKRKKNYSSNIITKDKKIDENKISKDAVAIFAFLNFKYFVSDENEKKKMQKKWHSN